MRSFYIITSSGIVLVHKDYIGSIKVQPRLLGSLLTALMELCSSSTNLQVSCICLNEISITFAIDAQTGLMCVVLHKTADGESLGKVLAQEILAAFLEEFRDLDFKKQSISLSIYQPFVNQMNLIMRNCVRAVLENMQQNRAIMATFTSKSFNIHVGPSVDELSLNANLQACQLVTNELMASLQDKPKEAIFHVGGHALIYKTFPGEKGSLIIYLKTNSLTDFRTSVFLPSCLIIEKLLM